MSEEDLDLLLTIDDPGEEDADVHLQIEDTVIGNGQYPVVFSQGGWTCSLSRLKATSSDPPAEGLQGSMTWPADQELEVDICVVTCSKNGRIVEQKVFYALDRIQTEIGIP